MKRNVAIIWTALATLLCGWPGICLLTFDLPGLITQPPGQPDIISAIYLALVGLIFLAFAIIVSFGSFRLSKASGMTGLALMIGLSGLLQLCGALIFILAAAAATDTDGIAETIFSFSVSGLFLVGVSVLIWFIRSRFRKPAEGPANEPPNTGLS